METEVVLRPPEIPSKWDIIPIHSSDVSAFKRCRRYWDWNSPTRNNLRRRVEFYGISIAPWFGNGIHYALEMMYDPMLQRDPVEAFQTWYQYQWEGGVVTEDWLERTYDVHAQAYDPDMDQAFAMGAPDDVISQGIAAEQSGQIRTYKIRGLRELLPDPIDEEFEMHRQLGIGMLTYYKEWAKKNDDFVVVAAESTYSIPLGFEAVDQREDSPNYGKKLEVHARGKRDAVLYFPNYAEPTYGINDYKTAIKIGDEYSAKLAKDEQCSNYLWATMQEAKLYDLPWQGHKVDRILYTALRKNYPKPPTPLKNGFPSINRTTEGTTAELFRQYVESDPMMVDWFKTDEKAQAYYNYLVNEGDKLFIIRDLVTRNKYEIQATGDHLVMIAKEMLNSPAIYPNPTGNYLCINCAFRQPCIAKDDGSDWQGMLLDGYEENRDR